MAISIHTNLMAGNAARTLGSHYNRLSKSVQRLSSGLRINSAADDAAGLAIRELMRADVSTLNQGIRNANDAISMIQTADGALAVIDEKLIRMKELAEQAATGTYNSTQRLIISSEYQAMAAEIDRIANATDFNGIKLLDGSLSGTHNGRGLNSTGAMKIHFGTGNASAEDYYYVEIGACTTEALGLGAFETIPGRMETVRVETVTYDQKTFKPKTEYIEYIDPDTGRNYYTDGDFFFSNVDNPVSTALDWEKDGAIIKRLRMAPATTTTGVEYAEYFDPDTGQTWYGTTGGGVRQYASDPHQFALTQLDRNDPDDMTILNRLQPKNLQLTIRTKWEIYESPDGNTYYTCDNGLSFSPNTNRPWENVVWASDPADKPLVDSLSPRLKVKTVSKPEIKTQWDDYIDTATNTFYYSRDGGKTFVSNMYKPDETTLDPVNDKAIIDRLTRYISLDIGRVEYVIYRHADNNKSYFSKDGGKTFVDDVKTPDNVIFDSSDPAHAADVGKLSIQYITSDWPTPCDTYRDPAGNYYYTPDKGANFFTDLTDVYGSRINAADPANAAVIASLTKLNQQTTVRIMMDSYTDPVTNRLYRTPDGGQTFYFHPSDFYNPDYSSSNPDDLAIIDRLVRNTQIEAAKYTCEEWRDPWTNIVYYTRKDGDHQTFTRNLFNIENIALDANNANQKNIIDRLRPVYSSSTSSQRVEFPDEYLVYEDSRNGRYYYSYDGGQSYFTSTGNPYSTLLDPNDVFDQMTIDRLRPLLASKVEVSLEERFIPPRILGGASISTQEAAQNALVAIDRAIVSKDKIRAHLGALQNRLENTVTNLSIQAENLQASESRISDTDVATEMTAFVRNQILTESATAMLSQANSFPHMLMNLLQG